MASIQELIYKQKANAAISPGAASSEASGVEVYSTTVRATLVSDGTIWRYANTSPIADFMMAGIA